MAFPPGSSVFRCSPNNPAAEQRRVETSFDHADQIIMTEPCGKVAWLVRFGQTSANPDRQAFDPVLVPVESRQQLAIGLGKTIETIGTQIAVLVQGHATFMKADRMIG